MREEAAGQEDDTAEAHGITVFRFNVAKIDIPTSLLDGISRAQGVGRAVLTRVKVET